MSKKRRIILIDETHQQLFFDDILVLNHADNIALIAVNLVFVIVTREHR